MLHKIHFGHATSDAMLACSTTLRRREVNGLRKGDSVDLHPHQGALARAAWVLFGCVLAGCNGNGGGGDRPVPPVQANVASMDAIGDSISKGFNAVDDGEFCQAEQES